MSVLQDRMFYGLKKTISDNENIFVVIEEETTTSSEYVRISLDDLDTTAPNAGSTTFVGTFNLDFYTNNKDARIVRNLKSRLVEVLGDNTYNHTTTVHYYFNGEVEDTEDGTEDDDYEFRIIYTISHTKVR